MSSNTARIRPRSLPTLGALALVACVSDDPTAAPLQSPNAPPISYAGAQSVANFELVGGYRLDVMYASEGLALVRDAEGYAVEAIAGAHTHTASVHLFDLRAVRGVGSDAAAYPLLTSVKTWKVAELFPRWISQQSLRDITVVATAGGYELAGIGRVFYNTAPRATTQVNVRTIFGSGASSSLGATREIPIDLPEQEFSGFIKHDDARADLNAIGAGAYDSGQGSVGGLSYAVREASGRWRRLLTPPGFGDLTSPRLPRDADYACPGGSSWVCIEPSGGKGVWSTERIGGGGVKYGHNLVFIATLGYGPRTYAQQSYTFGDPAQDKAVAYFFREDSLTSAVAFQRYDRWVFAAPHENVIGVALGRVRGVDGLVLFVVKTNAWGPANERAGSVLQLFRIKPT